MKKGERREPVLERKKYKTQRRIFIAGTNSGCGKTTITCGLLYCLKKRGFLVQAYKCGPDYIDPLLHARVLGQPSGNLDSFFTSEDTLLSLLKKQSEKADISIIEGVMGYYDGIGMTERAGSMDVAKKTKTPVILVVDASGMGSSVFAVLKGFLTYQKPSGITGVIFNRMSEGLYPKAAKKALDWGVMPLGYVPANQGLSLKSRHLGLIVEEPALAWDKQLADFGSLLEKTVDIDGIMALSEGAEALPMVCLSGEMEKTVDFSGITIAVARDAAFSFLYEDNLRFLRDRGCNLIFFSPLSDKTLPKQADGLILCGGYPELYAKALSENTSMKESVRNAVLFGLPCIAECGGFLYLHRELEDERGEKFPMAGVFSGLAYKGKGKKRFGYITLEGTKDSLLLKKGEQIRAHEFHYWDSADSGRDFFAKKASGAGAWETGHGTSSLYAGFPHIYFYGNEQAAVHFLEAARSFQEMKKGAFLQAVKEQEKSGKTKEGKERPNVF